MPEDPQTSAGAPTGAPGQRPSDGNDGVPSPQSSEPEIANPEAKKYAEEAARLRHELKAVQKENAEHRAYRQEQDNAKLTQDQRRDKDLADAQERASAAELRAQQTALRAEVKLIAKDLGLNQALALRLLDQAALEFNDDGDPTNVAALLTKAIEEYGLGAVAPQAPAPTDGANGKSVAAPRQPTSIGATPANPTRADGVTIGGWSWDLISNLTKEQYEALTPAQRNAMSNFIRRTPVR